MTTVDAIGWAGTLTGILLGLPQAVRLIRTGHVEGLSLTAWQALLAVNLAWTQHGLRIGQAPQVVTSVLSLCSTVPILWLLARALGRSPTRAMLPGLAGALAMVAVDQFLGTAAYGTVAVVPAVIANAGQTIQLVRARDISGVSPLFLLLATVNQVFWLTWAILVADAGTTITAAATGAGALLNLGWWLARTLGLQALRPLPAAAADGHDVSTGAPGRAVAAHDASSTNASAVADPGCAV